MNDRNKSQLTHDVTKACSAWLDNHGFKPWETEVCLPWTSDNEPGWIADIAAAIIPTQTELINLKLLPRRPSPKPTKDWYLLRRKLTRLLTCAVEVKVSRADFKADKKWTRVPPADLAYLCYPAGMLKPSDWPLGWGILEFYSKERVVCKRVPCVWQNTTDTVRLGMMFNIGLRKDHSVRYASFKKADQEHRICVNENYSRIRMTDALRLCLDVLKGALVDRYGAPNSVAVVLERYRIKKLPRDLLEQLTEVWGTGK